MKTNELPVYDMSDNSTGFCPRFKPDGWDAQELHFRDKRFVRATTRSLMHIPINMGKVFTRVMTHIQKANGFDTRGYLTLSRDTSPFATEHLFAVDKDIPDEQMTTISGDYVTKVFEGPYRKSGQWRQDLIELARSRGKEPKSIWFFYTTCPKCSKTYGKNYVVGVAEQ